MKKVIYDPINGVPIPDGECWRMALGLPEECCVSTTNVINAVNCAVNEGELKPKDVCFEFEGEILEYDEETVLLSRWPKGFDDITYDFARRTIMAIVNRSKEKAQNEG